MIRKLTAVALTLGIVACAHRHPPPASSPGARHFPRNEKITPVQPLLEAKP